MRFLRWLGLLSFVLLVAAAAPPAQPIRESLLEAAAGRPLLLALDGEGRLVARTVDGAFSRTLLPGPYGAGVADAQRDLVWLRGERALDVLDLRATSLAPVTVVTYPDGALEKLGAELAEPPRWSSDRALFVQVATPCRRSAGLVLEWARDGASAAAWAAGFRAVAKSWLFAEERRTRNELGPEPYPTGHLRRKAPANVGTCKHDGRTEVGRRRCGEAVPFGGTGLELVVVGASTERCPAEQCALVNPRSKKVSPVPGFALDDEAAASCGPFWFDRTGRFFLVGERVCTATLECTVVGRRALGWLEGGHLVGH
jgi:hypothetical protein